MFSTLTVCRLPLLGAFAAALTLLPASPGYAASITWGTPATISADTDVSTAGSLLYAYTMGNTGVPSAIVNGVTFAPFAVPHGTLNPVTVGSVTLAIAAFPPGATLASDNATGGSSINPFAAFSTAYKGLLQSAVSTSNSFTFFTVTLGGLTNGQEYAVQFWSNNSGGVTILDSKTNYVAGSSVILDNNTTDAFGGVGQWVSGVFVADATTQVVTLEASAIHPPVLNGFQVRAVPEPSTTLLLVAGAALCWRRCTLRQHENGA